jgi:hypothetical protein
VEVLETEQRRACQTSVPPPVWTLYTGPQHLSQSLQMINLLYNCSGQHLRRLPHVRIDSSPALDAGGVFRAHVNQAWTYLLEESGIFDRDQAGRKSFAIIEVDPLGIRKKHCIVFGKILYWCVLIHRIIPYPIDLNPAIVAYAIYGSIPFTVLQQVNNSVATIANIIRSYNSRTSADNIHPHVLEWISAIQLDLANFMFFLRSREFGPEYLAEQISTGIVLGRNREAFNHVREGFQFDLGFTSVSS